LRSLELDHWYFSDAGVGLLATTRLDSLEELSLVHNEIGAPGLAALGRAPFLANLTALDLELNQLDAGAAAVLADTRTPRLTRLGLCNNTLGAEGVAPLARSPLLAGLRELDLGYNDLTSAAVEALVAAPPQRLRELSLIGSDFDDHGARLLAGCPALRS